MQNPIFSVVTLLKRNPFAATTHGNRRLTRPYSPESNGKAEITVGLLKKVLLRLLKRHYRRKGKKTDTENEFGVEWDESCLDEAIKTLLQYSLSQSLTLHRLTCDFNGIICSVFNATFGICKLVIFPNFSKIIFRLFFF